MEAQISAPLLLLEESINSLLVPLTTTNTFAGATTAAQNILSADDALTSALGLLKQHQDNYTRILSLRSEAELLHERLRTIVQTCNDLRSEAEQFYNEDSDSDDDDAAAQDKTTDIDYEALLAFAARIGKHNAAAAREAEDESTRRRIEAMKKKTEPANGDITAESQEDRSTQNATEESQAALAAISEAMAMQRAAVGISFPPPDRLRMGVLGQLQLLREQSGEHAVEEEVQRLVKQSEDVTKEAERDVREASESVALHEPLFNTTLQDRGEPVPTHSLPKEQKKINLDFDEFGSDEDE